MFAIVGGEVTEVCRSLKVFYGLSDLATVFKENIDKVFDHKTPANRVLSKGKVTCTGVKDDISTAGSVTAMLLLFEAVSP